jgi:hypothetical protein
VDQVPLSQDAGIEVDVTTLSGGAQDPVDGKVTWTLQLPAHGEQAVELAFSVVIPDELSYVANELNLML